MSLSKQRREYQETGLSFEDLAPNPILQFRQWLQEAIAAKLPEPNAMTLATVGSDAKPTARTVLLKEVNYRGFFFFTNYESRKGKDLSENPGAALVFFWREKERQVSVTGLASKISREESEAYFSQRPLGSRLGAWASQQSQAIDSRAVLEKRYEHYRRTFGEHVPLPDFWGGYVLAPETIEFWQGRANRLHDRFRYTLTTSEQWRLERLSP